MSKILVAYFSASGTTAKVAEAIAKTTGADLYEILPAVPYTTKDLDWMDPHSRTSVEMHDRQSRPARKDEGIDMAPYDTIFLGFPIWWYIAPTIVNAFLEECDTAGKKIILFATSGSSGFGKTAASLEPSVAPDATILEGKVFHGGVTPQEVERWVKSIS